MHFLFANSKVCTSNLEGVIEPTFLLSFLLQIAIVDSKNLAKLGTMHLCAVNVWTW
jgi:hypothetical protein